MATLKDLVVNGTIRAIGPIYGDSGFIGNLDWKYVQNKVKASQTTDGIMSKEDKLALDKMAILYTKFRDGWTLITQELHNQGITDAKPTSTPAEVKQYIVDLKNKASSLACYDILEATKCYEVWKWEKGTPTVENAMRINPSQSKEIYFAIDGIASGNYSYDYRVWGHNCDEESEVASEATAITNSQQDNGTFLLDDIVNNISFYGAYTTGRILQLQIRDLSGTTILKTLNIATVTASLKYTQDGIGYRYLYGGCFAITQLDNCHYIISSYVETGYTTNPNYDYHGYTGYSATNFRLLTLTAQNDALLQGAINLTSSITAANYYNTIGIEYGYINFLYPRTRYQDAYTVFTGIKEKYTNYGKYTIYLQNGKMGPTSFSFPTTWSNVASWNENASFKDTDGLETYQSGGWDRNSKYSAYWWSHTAQKTASFYQFSRYQRINNTYQIKTKVSDTGAPFYAEEVDCAGCKYYRVKNFSFCGVAINASPVFIAYPNKELRWFVVDACRAYNSYVVEDAINTAYWKQITLKNKNGETISPTHYGQLEIYEGNIARFHYVIGSKAYHKIGTLVRTPEEPSWQNGEWSIIEIGDL